MKPYHWIILYILIAVLLSIVYVKIIPGHLSVVANIILAFMGAGNIFWIPIIFKPKKNE